ncbi:NAD(P)H-dependent FMN reductase [Roseibium aquae]|uniref:NAD(P)H-dependent FMN reductase n=1 Tax=Roseibium aquae TaxID=1323746 RepID=A0A916T4W3_9HYPH|nr:NAD(P)H-dependent oxidoreductase [Roseibium aquae]GGB31963.1 NAD(P)H-dependent FMN reductase [Roseibium aquae]
MKDVMLLGSSGSLRKGSVNTLLVKEAARLFVPETFVLADIRMPLYDGDLEDLEGIPEAARVLYDQMREADAIVISTPEYNKGVPGVLKNALDWVSRKQPMPLAGKPVAVLSAGGWTGGARSQYMLRHCLTPFDPRLLSGPEVLIANAGTAFCEDGRLKDPASVSLLQQLMDKLKT